MPTDEEFRDVGFTSAARQYPRSELGNAMMAAFNGVTVDELPEAMKFYPNPYMRDAWERVAEAARQHIAKETE
jgi:hypothetical protein